MMKLSLEDLRKIRDAARSEANLEESGVRGRINVHLGTCGVGSGAMKILETVQEEVEKKGIKDIRIATSGCAGLCSREPMITAESLGLPTVKYVDLDREKTQQIIAEHFLEGKIVEKYALGEIPFFSLQCPRVLRNRGIIDPEKIEDYIAQDGYEALYKALTQMTPEQIIAEVKASGLRGRGGAGFPTGDKWEEGRKYNRFPKYVICNGDEGDPGAFMDRSVLEADPHAVLEGMAICATAIDSHEGYLYVRAEYPLAIKRLQIAIGQARNHGLLGKDIFGTGFDFDVWVYPGAGAFVCGESTALMYSLEGKRGMPRAKPPRSAEAGLWGQPTVLNNVETFANIPQILLHGAQWFNSVGTERSKGTKVFSLAGAVSNIGLVEVPMGISLRSIVYEIGEGIKGKKKFKAAQLGGPSGGFVPEHLLDTPVDYESLEATGAIMGSGGVVICDESTCMVDAAKFFTNFCVEESCGKCVPCRVGLRVMLHKLEDIVAGKGQEGDMEFLEELGQHIKRMSHCGLGQSAPNPVLSTIRHFRAEYDAHIKDKRCPALACTALIRFEVIPENCKMCGMCYRACPSGAIVWEKKQVARIDLSRCLKCKACIRACKFGAIE
jgi:NADH:ubiquinone oxidoreductase subunit F (NADH-binding)/(2Fe-2S) ferredoxin/NAD-dependent dihydropyrimidine dehydrogenase PreA subunit